MACDSVSLQVNGPNKVCSIFTVLEMELRSSHMLKLY